MSGKGIWVLGAGGHSKVALAVARAAGLTVSGVFDSNPATHGIAFSDLIVANPPAPEFWAETDGFIAIGDNKTRHRLAGELGANWSHFVHPSSVIDRSVGIGSGTLICATSVVQPDAQIGDHVILNTGSIVEHDCIVEDYAHIAGLAYLAGDARIGVGALIGAGAIVLPGIRVGNWSVVGAGAVVASDVADGETVFGVPARVRLS